MRCLVQMTNIAYSNYWILVLGMIEICFHFHIPRKGLHIACCNGK